LLPRGEELEVKKFKRRIIKNAPLHAFVKPYVHSIKKKNNLCFDDSAKSTRVGKRDTGPGYEPFLEHDMKVARIIKTPIVRFAISMLVK